MLVMKLIKPEIEKKAVSDVNVRRLGRKRQGKKKKEACGQGLC